MARGRMLSKSLSTSEKFAALVVEVPELFEFCQSLYPLLIAHTDDFGRLQGDPFTVKHQCHPASPRPLDDFGAALGALHAVGLIEWYAVVGRHYVQIPEFERHQQGLHKRTRSRFPRVPGTEAEVPGIAPDNPGQEKGTKEKRTKENRTEEKKKDHTIRAVLEQYETRFFAKFNAKPNIERPKDPAIVKRLVDKHGEDTVGVCLAELFEIRDPFIQGTGYTIGVFSSCFNKLLVSVNGRQRVLEHQPWVCPHTPRCPHRAACAIVAARSA